MYTVHVGLCNYYSNEATDDGLLYRKVLCFSNAMTLKLVIVLHVAVTLLFEVFLVVNIYTFCLLCAQIVAYLESIRDDRGGGGGRGVAKSLCIFLIQAINVNAFCWGGGGSVTQLISFIELLRWPLTRTNCNSLQQLIMTFMTGHFKTSICIMTTVNHTRISKSSIYHSKLTDCYLIPMANCLSRLTIPTFQSISLGV